MPLNDIQRRGREIGRIRIGITVRAANGKMRPEKLETFRLTSRARGDADAAARVLGGEVRPITEGRLAGQWEVITEATELPVMVPPGEKVISQDYEFWTAAGCARRCDGFRATLYGGEGGERRDACQCPPAGPERAAAAAKMPPQACKPTTRVSVMLPDLPDLGVWRIESHGFYAAVELGGAAELLEKARDAGVMLPATLRLEQREVRRPGQKPRQFGVPVLSIDITMRQLAIASGSEEVQRALPPAPARALEASGGARPRALESAPPAPAQHPQQTATPTAQEIADHARLRCNTTEAVTGCGRKARDLGLLEELVEAEPGSDAVESLDSYLRHRLAEVQRKDQPTRAAHPFDGGPNRESSHCLVEACGRYEDDEIHGGP